MKNIIAILLIISNLSLFSQIDLNVSMLEMSNFYSDITFMSIKEWEKPEEPNLKYFAADFGYQEYYYITDSLDIVNVCMFKYNKFRLPSLIWLYNQQYKVIKPDQSWEYTINMKHPVIITIERNEKVESNDYFIVHTLQFAN
jgi:hypothetical protein